MLATKIPARPANAKSTRAEAIFPQTSSSSSFTDIFKENALLFGIALLLFILAAVMTFSQ
jgi:hypothetical protein